MAYGSLQVSMSVDTRFARWWVRLIRALAPVLVVFVSQDRVFGWAKGGALRLMRYRIGERGRWRWFTREER